MVQPVTETSLPVGDYAIVEALGHRTYAGRVAEVERFGAKMLQIEPLYRDWMLDPLFLSGAALYQFTPCTPAAAWSGRAKVEYDLPASIAASLPEQTAPDWPPAFLADRAAADGAARYGADVNFIGTSWAGDEIAGDGA